MSFNIDEEVRRTPQNHNRRAADFGTDGPGLYSGSRPVDLAHVWARTRTGTRRPIVHSCKKNALANGPGGFGVILGSG